MAVNGVFLPAYPQFTICLQSPVHNIDNTSNFCAPTFRTIKERKILQYAWTFPPLKSFCLFWIRIRKTFVNKFKFFVCNIRLIGKTVKFHTELKIISVYFRISFKIITVNCSNRWTGFEMVFETDLRGRSKLWHWIFLLFVREIKIKFGLTSTSG